MITQGDLGKFFVRWLQEQLIHNGIGQPTTIEQKHQSGPFLTFELALTQAENLCLSPGRKNVQVFETEEKDVWDVAPLPRSTVTKAT